MSKRGFTLVELLVVIAIIGVLVALLLPAVQAAREAARRAQCVNNEKQIALAALNYEDANKALPRGHWSGESCNKTKWSSRWSAFVSVLPYIEEQSLFDQLNTDIGPSYQSGNSAAWANVAGRLDAMLKTPKAFRCPTSDAPQFSEDPDPSVFVDHKLAIGDYAFMTGVRGPSWGNGCAVKDENTGPFLYGKEVRIRNITDGLSHTVFLGEVIEPHTRKSSNVWTFASRHADSLRSTENPLNTPPGMLSVVPSGNTAGCNGAFGSKHTGGGHFAFGDGRVMFIADEISSDIYNALGTIAGNEVQPGSF
jgi:prepilin-type N-terminal cleavage/methylation domain-containing protein